MTRISTVDYNPFDLRTLADIEKKLAKWDRRSVIYRRLRAKKYKKMVAAWKLGLENILQVFNVRPVPRVMTVVNFPLHKAIPINTDPAAAAVDHDVMDTQTITSGVQNDVVNTPVGVSDSHHKALKRPEDLRSQNQPVSIIYSICRRVATDLCLASRQVSDLGRK